MRALGVVGGDGRLREDSESSKQPEGRIKMKGTEVTAAFLVQHLQGQHTPQRTRGGDHPRARIRRLGNESIEAALSQQRQAEEHPCDPRTPAASRRQRDTTHLSDERMVWTDDGGTGALTGRAAPPWGQEKGGT